VNVTKYLLIPIFIIIAGCSEPTIDGSNEDSIQQSIEQVRTSLPESEQDAFDEAVQILAFSQIDFSDIMSAGAGLESGESALLSKMGSAIDGKTGQQIIAEAERIRIEREERARAQALTEIDELTAKQEEARKAEQAMARFEVVRSRFYKQEQQYMSDQPIIELTVRNGTVVPISRAYFEGTLASPGRSVPWLKETFNYGISGGLEPGEEATWSLAPNPYSEWGTVDVPDDAILTVTVRKLDGADGEPIFDSTIFSERERIRLQTLLEDYGSP
jgi:hypothetical protein